MIHMIYMAAGNSRRFGENENKLLYNIENRPMYQHGFHKLVNLCEVRDDCDLTVVTQYDEIYKYVKDYSKRFHQFKHSYQIAVVLNKDSRLGISYTIKAAIKTIYPLIMNPATEDMKEDFLLFMVADQPYIKENTIKKLIDFAGKGTETASVIYKNRPGNPTLISARFLSELMNLQGDQGGRHVIHNHSCIYLEADAEEELLDIDYKRE